MDPVMEVLAGGGVPIVESDRDMKIRSHQILACYILLMLCNLHVDQAKLN